MSKENFLQLREDVSRNLQITLPGKGDLLGFTLTPEEGLPVNVYFDEVRDQIVFFCGLGAVAEERKNAALEKAMALNLYAAATNGGAIGYDAETSLLSLARTIPIGQINLPAFQAELRAFADTALRVLVELLASEQAAGQSGISRVPDARMHV